MSLRVCIRSIYIKEFQRNFFKFLVSKVINQFASLYLVKTYQFREISLGLKHTMNFTNLQVVYSFIPLFGSYFLNGEQHYIFNLFYILFENFNHIFHIDRIFANFPAIVISCHCNASVAQSRFFGQNYLLINIYLELTYRYNTITRNEFNFFTYFRNQSHVDQISAPRSK